MSSMSQVDKLLEVVRRAVGKLYPELANRYHLTARARVVSASGDIKLQPLTRDGRDDETAPLIVHEPIPATIKPGDVVLIGYTYGDPSEPFLAPLSTCAVGTITAGGFLPDGHKKAVPYILDQRLDAHFRLATLTAPVDDDGIPLPGAETSPLTRIDYKSMVKPGDRVAGVAIEEGARFVIVAKL